MDIKVKIDAFVHLLKVFWHNPLTYHLEIPRRCRGIYPNFKIPNQCFGNYEIPNFVDLRGLIKEPLLMLHSHS